MEYFGEQRFTRVLDKADIVISFSKNIYSDDSYFFLNLSSGEERSGSSFSNLLEY